MAAHVRRRCLQPGAVDAAKGWLVFQPNYRGSDNLGRQFQGAISNDAGAGPGRDVIAGIEAIKQRGIVDETRMAVSGWSYGGYMTSWMLLRPARGRDRASVTNQLIINPAMARAAGGNDSPGQPR
jgi:dipeptidyl aminopeptidase/acylaminoacyl peptidase